MAETMNVNTEVIAVANEDNEAVVEPKGFLGKTKDWIKRHKKGLIIAGLGCALLVAAGIQKARKSDEDIELGEDDYSVEFGDSTDGGTEE